MWVKRHIVNLDVGDKNDEMMTKMSCSGLLHKMPVATDW
jgi:hypothetical protein